MTFAGALFDGSRLAECQRDSPTSCAVPGCTVAWVPTGTISFHVVIVQKHYIMSML